MKNQYWQTIRGICILAVVMIHCPKGVTGLDQVVWLCLRQLINFPVAVFIFMAGYFVNSSKVSINWLKIRGGGRLLVPFLVWSTVYSIKNAIFSETTIRSLAIGFITGKAAAPLYYILVLIQLTLLTYFLVKKRNGLLYLLTPFYLCFLYFFNITAGKMPRFYETIFLAWFIFYLLGMDTREEKIHFFKVRWWMILTAFLVSIAEAFILLKIGCDIGFACSQIKFSSFIYSALIALWLVQNVKDSESNILSIIGDCSFGIYFFHMLVLWVVSKVFSLVGVDVWIIKWILTFVLTSGISFGFVFAVRKLFEEKKIIRFIGFE